MKKYRITIETQFDGKKWYYIEKRFFIWWRPLIGSKIWPVKHSSIEEVEQAIENDKKQILEQLNKVIVKTEYFYNE